MVRLDPVSRADAAQRLHERYGAFDVKARPACPKLTPRDVFGRPSFLVPYLAGIAILVVILVRAAVG